MKVFNRVRVLHSIARVAGIHWGGRTFVPAICALAAFAVVCERNACAQSSTPFQNEAEVAKAMAVQNAYQAPILATEGVQGIGIGETNGALAILVLVDNTNSAAQVPPILDNLPVNVRVVGSIHAVPCAGNISSNAFPLPVPLGVSGGNALLFGGCCASGTIGFKVRDNTTGFIGWISNNHVVGHGTDGCPSTAPIGTVEYQPGSVDATPTCGTAQNIGTLSRVIPIDFSGGDNVVDAGFVQSTDLAISSDILNLGPQVNNVVPAFVGQVVRKNGRTSDCTEGTVVGINMTIDVNYSESAPCATTCGTATFTNQIMYSPTAPSTAMSEPGDSGSPVVDANNNAVALNFAGDDLGNGYGNPIGSVLSALNVSLASSTSTQVITRTSRFWFTHGYSSDTNCATLLKALQLNGGALNLGFVTLPTANENADNVIDANDAFMEALSFYWRSQGKTGEIGGTQNAKLKGSSLCKARKQLAVELIAASANVGLLGTWPPNATYTNQGTVANFPADLISQAQAAGAGFDVVAIRAMTALLKKFNSSGLANDFPNGLVECTAQSSKMLKPIARDPTTQATCPGVNNSCDAAATVWFPNSSDQFAAAVFKQTVSLGAYTNNMPAPTCNTGGRDAVWKVIPSVGTNGRQFTVYSSGSNFNTMLAVWSGTCDSLIPVTCADQSLGNGGEILTFTTDGFNTFYIVGEGATGQYGKMKIKITSP